MRAVLDLIWRLSGLVHPSWPLQVGREGSVPARRTDGSGSEEWEGETIPRLEGPGSPRRLTRCDLGGAALKDLSLERMDGCRASGSRWEGVRIQQATLCDLEGARLRDTEGTHLVTCSLRDASWTGGRVEEAVLCDLGHAHLEGVGLGRLRACDLTDATLKGCDLSSADLSGCVLRRVRFVDTDPSRARVAGADIRGVRGLDRATLRSLVVAGARLQGASTWRLLKKLLPGADPLRICAVAAWLERGAWLLALVPCALALWAVLHPPPVSPVPSVPAARSRAATAIETERTQQALARVRASLAQAHEAMVRSGGRPGDWPSMADFQANQYDVDGSGPSEARAPLVPGGMPDNLLTDAQGGVLPYCNEIPTQETLSGVDTDWHYCDLTGRVFASAGYTGLPTVQW